MRAIIFRIAAQEYLLEVESIREIVEAENIYHLPKASDFIVGTIRKFGRVVPVIDLSKVLSNISAKKTIESCIFIVQAGEYLMGLMVDAASEIVDIDEELIETAEFPAGASVVALSPFIKGTVYLDERLLILLDIEKILAKKAAGRPAA